MSKNPPADGPRHFTILVADDEADVVDLVRYHLRKAGHTVIVADNGLAALETSRKGRPDLLVLDIMMPQMDGLEVCRQLKSSAETRDIPVLMLTAKAHTGDRITGLECGADDYLAKPFSPRELILRVESILRRSHTARASLDSIGPFEIDRARFRISTGGKKLELTSLEYKLLLLLIERRGKAQSRETLLQEVWGYPRFFDTRTVDTHVRRLRDKLGSHSSWLLTVRGEGYCFRAAEEK